MLKSAVSLILAALLLSLCSCGTAQRSLGTGARILKSPLHSANSISRGTVGTARGLGRSANASANTVIRNPFGVANMLVNGTVNTATRATNQILGTGLSQINQINRTVQNVAPTAASAALLVP